MMKKVLMSFVALAAIAAAATGPARAQSHQKYTSAVAMTSLQVGDTLAEGFSLTGEDANFIYFVQNRHKHNENLSAFLESITLDQIQSIGANCVFSTLVNDESITFAPVDGNGQNGDAWVVTEVESSFGFTNITIGGITMPVAPALYTVKMAPGTEDSTSWSFNPAAAATTGVAEGTEVNISYGGTRKVKSVVATVVPNAPAAPAGETVTWDNTNVFVAANEDARVNMWENASFTYGGVTIALSATEPTQFYPYTHAPEGYVAMLTVFGDDGDSFTFTAPTGKEFSRIEITNADQGYSFTAYGDWTNDEDNNKAVWSGTPSSTVTLGGSNLTVFNNLQSIVFTLVDAN